jgi:integrase
VRLVAPLEGNTRRIARTVTSCRSCLAWGLTYRRGLCRACYGFSSRHGIAGDCGGCGRRERLKKGYCRLCSLQAARDRITQQGTSLAPYLRDVRHQQLSLIVCSRRFIAPRGVAHQPTIKGQPLKPPPPVPGRPRMIGVQLLLFVVPRRYRYGRVNLSCDPVPENEWLVWALHLARTMAEAHGFDPVVLRELNMTLVMLLAEHCDGELIRSSDFYDVLRERNVSIRHTSEVLETMGVLDDDRTATFTFENWLANKLEGLAPGIRSETEAWAHALHDGTPRTPPMAPVTVKGYFRFARPALLEWSARHNHLREVTLNDILAHLDSLYGSERSGTLVALRSLFTWARKNNLVFHNPTRQIKTTRLTGTIWQPLLSEEIASTITAATTPHARLFVALAAVHAGRAQAIRALNLDDVDLPNRRLTIAGHTRPLDELTHRVLLEWLNYRRERWPNTANRHLLISTKTAVGLGPVSPSWPRKILLGTTATLERLRIDRQLEEAITHGADPLHLALVFDLDESTAIRYAASARQLLAQPHERHPSASPQTQASIGNNHSTKHSGSH